MHTEKMKILVIDDNQMNRKLFRALLTQNQYAVIEAVNGSEGVELAMDSLPDLIFMDIQMPVMDGTEALKLLKGESSTKNIPVVALTSYAMKGDREKLLDAGFSDYLAKPIDIDVFLETVKRHTTGLERRDVKYGR